MTVVEAEVGGRLVHQVGKSSFRPGQAFGYHDAGVVAGLHRNAAQQFAYGYLRIDLNKHA